MQTETKDKESTLSTVLWTVGALVIVAAIAVYVSMG